MSSLGSTIYARLLANHAAELERAQQAEQLAFQRDRAFSQDMQSFGQQSNAQQQQVFDRQMSQAQLAGQNARVSGQQAEDIGGTYQNPQIQQQLEGGWMQQNLSEDKIAQAAYQAMQLKDAEARAARQLETQKAGSAMDRTMVEQMGQNARNENPAIVAELAKYGYKPGTPEYQRKMDEWKKRTGTQINIDNSTGPLTTGTKTKIQEDVYAKGGMARQWDTALGQLKEDDFGYKARIKGAGGVVMENLGLAGKETKDFNNHRAELIAPLTRLFNSYRSQITGAAASVQELDRLLKSFPNETMSYSQFMGQAKSLMAQIQDEIDNGTATLGANSVSAGATRKGRPDRRAAQFDALATQKMSTGMSREEAQDAAAKELGL